MDISLAKLLSEEDSFGVFVLVSILMGGGAAYLSGRAIAATWRPLWHGQRRRTCWPTACGALGTTSLRA